MADLVANARITHPDQDRVHPGATQDHPPIPDRYYGGQQLGPSPLTDGHVLQMLPRYNRSCTPRRHAISGWACVMADGRDR